MYTALKSSVPVVALLSGILTITLWLVPAARDFLMDHPLVLLLLGVFFIIVAYIAGIFFAITYHQSSIDNLRIEKEEEIHTLKRTHDSERESLLEKIAFLESKINEDERRKLERDSSLAREITTNWSVDSQMTQALKQGFHYRNFPIPMADGILNLGRDISSDPREFHSDEFKDAISDLESAAISFHSSIAENLWTRETETGQLLNSMSIPAEWKAYDYERYDRATDELEEKERLFNNSLDLVNKLIYKFS